jgi:hypothetical protein
MYKDRIGNSIRFLADNDKEKEALKALFEELTANVDQRTGRERLGMLFTVRLVDEDVLKVTIGEIAPQRHIKNALQVTLDKSDVISPVERRQHIQEIFKMLDKHLGKKMY